ncbi:N-acetyltransferase [Pseudoalteromonas fuliginea]|uniref:N-acetyltransferase n=1 Tax=Pseudoalteromonas fuliginea TaxID=1872678 RepID=A0AB73BBR3_9GAMM|nr:GNAT family N-acetyltransferase [Pseudoalteromonas fuliginea]KAA1156468.1 N-acetyltransferase [Pseudoalteromonas fuliginea]
MQLFTERLKMRQLSDADWSVFLQLHREPDVLQYCFDMPKEVFVRQRFEQRLPIWDPDSRHPLCFAVINNETQEVIGVTGFTYDGITAELGYLFLPKHFSKGYATESLRTVIEWARQECGIKQFKAVVTRGNTSSENVLSKCGLTQTDTIPQSHLIAGTRYDDLIYTLKV